MAGVSSLGHTLGPQSHILSYRNTQFYSTQTVGPIGKLWPLNAHLAQPQHCQWLPTTSDSEPESPSLPHSHLSREAWPKGLQPSSLQTWVASGQPDLPDTQRNQQSDPGGIIPTCSQATLTLANFHTGSGQPSPKPPRCSLQVSSLLYRATDIPT